jgi:hypothetical protein
MAANTGHEAIEHALQRALTVDNMDFPFGMSPEEGAIYKRGLVDAYHHALEMIPTGLEGPDGWLANVKYLLDNCPHTVRSNYKGAGENLLESLILTFMAMQRKL